jgi:predicted XRE-type DNA-binding protein
MDTNQRIKSAMRQKMAKDGISQSELAQRLGIKQPSVAALLSPNKAKVPESLLNGLDALGLELVVQPKNG